MTVVSQWDKKHILVKWISSGQAKVTGNRNGMAFCSPFQSLTALGVRANIDSWSGGGGGRKEGEELRSPSWHKVGSEAEGKRRWDPSMLHLETQKQPGRKDLRPSRHCCELLCSDSRGRKLVFLSFGVFSMLFQASAQLKVLTSARELLIYFYFIFFVCYRRNTIFFPAFKIAGSLLITHL